MAWTLLATQCTKQLTVGDEANADQQASQLKSVKLNLGLSVNAYPGEPQRPVNWTIAGSALYTGNSALETGWMDVRNDNSSIFLVMNNIPWRASTQNLNIWIGLAGKPLPLSPNGMPNVTRFPIKLTVPPGTDQYCVEIEFATLSKYLGVPVTCESDFSMMTQADVLQNGKAFKAWAGNNNAGNAPNNTFYWFGRIEAYCGSGMPTP
jgi:hypothetical protein